MDQELVAVCQEIFQNIISQITLHLRFMDVALDRFIFVPESTSIECDGTYVYYHPIYLVKTFKNHPTVLTRGYLHMVLHAVFSHPYLTAGMDRQLWNLACDIAVENVISELKLDCLAGTEEAKKNQEIDKLKKHLSLLSAQKLYYYLKEELNQDQVKWLSGLFAFDDHSRWYKIRDVVNRDSTLYGEESKDDPAAAGKNRYDQASHDSDEAPAQSSEQDDSSPDEEPLSERDIEKIKASMKEWQEIADQIETDLQTFSKQYGDRAGSLVQNLETFHPEKYDYSTFLRKFMTVGEKTMVNDDEFDYVFYTYGLQLYQNMPLIESLEYKETSAIRDLVIAIDTSGSVSGPKVQAFLAKTYHIFRQKTAFFSRFNIHIIQCDACIQDDAKITSLEMFDQYIAQVQIHGLGGTDFRPVFQYVNELIEKKDINHLDGLLYFTDGDGAYPKQRPDYRTAFIFLEKPTAQVPAWAIQYILDEQEIATEGTKR